MAAPPVGMPQDVVAFRTRTVMPEAYADELWVKRPEFMVATVAGVFADIESRLRKRYRTPFADPKPAIVLRWMARIATPDMYRARGVDSSDEQIEELNADRAKAYEEIKEAADAKDGLYDLPLRDDADESAISKGAPFGYSEASPYAGMDRQAAAIGCGLDDAWRWR